MKRIPENEIMESKIQAEAYAAADFSEANNIFITNFNKSSTIEQKHHILDVGCGDGEIPIMIAKENSCKITAIDGSSEMLNQFRIKLKAHNISTIECINSIFNKDLFSQHSFDYIISNSVLHHVSNPHTFWDSLIHLTKTNGKIFVMDLLRPSTKKQMDDIVIKYGGSNNILLQDFSNSLRAAYTINEVKAHLMKYENISFNINNVSDRHFFVTIDKKK